MRGRGGMAGLWGRKGGVSRRLGGGLADCSVGDASLNQSGIWSEQSTRGCELRYWIDCQFFDVQGLGSASAIERNVYIAKKFR